MTLIIERGTRILDPISISENDVILPERCQKGYYPNWGVLKRGETGEFFLLTERAFKDRVDKFFGYLPTKLIEYFSDKLGELSILDIGGGRYADTAREIAQIYPTTQVINVDLVASEITEGNFRSINGDVLGLPCDDESIDLAYSHQVLPYLNDEFNYARHRKVLSEVVRVLSPGGVGLIDCTDELSLSGYILGDLRREMDGQVLPKSKSYGGGFLVIVKNPVDPIVAKLSTKVPNFKA